MNEDTFITNQKYIKASKFNYMNFAMLSEPRNSGQSFPTHTRDILYNTAKVSAVTKHKVQYRQAF